MQFTKAKLIASVIGATNDANTPSELPNTGPVEIILAVIIILGIIIGGYCLYRTKKTLKKVEDDIKGDDVTEEPK